MAWMNLLAWIVCFELVLAAAIFLLHGLALCVGASEPDDPLPKMTRAAVFALLSKPRPMGWLHAPPAPVEEKPAATAEQIKAEFEKYFVPGEDEPAEAWKPKQLSDSFYGRLPRAADGSVLMATLRVKVVPGASRDHISGMLGDALKVQVSAPPEDNKANKAVIQILAEFLNVRPFQVQILRGHYQPIKDFQIAGVEQAFIDKLLKTLQ